MSGRAAGGRAIRAGGAFLVNFLVNLLADSVFSQSIQPTFFKFHTWFLQGLFFHVMPCFISVGSQFFWRKMLFLEIDIILKLFFFHKFLCMGYSTKGEEFEQIFMQLSMRLAPFKPSSKIFY